MKSENLLLLLTGTVTPKRDIVNTALTDPDIRRSQYVKAIRYYLKNTDCKIVFIDNSNTDLSSEFSGFSDRIEFLTFSGNNFSGRGKGYGEMEIFEFFIQHSQLLSHEDIIVKITGRYIVSNLSYFIRYINTIENRRLLIVDLKHNLRFSDSRFFACTREFIEEYLLKWFVFVDDSEGFFFEHALNKASLTAIREGFNYSCLPDYPAYSGVYATEGKKYNDNFFYLTSKSLLYKLKFYLLTKY